MKKIIILSMLMMLLVSALGFALSVPENTIYIPSYDFGGNEIAHGIYIEGELVYFAGQSGYFGYYNSSGDYYYLINATGSVFDEAKDIAYNPNTNEFYFIELDGSLYRYSVLTNEMIMLSEIYGGTGYVRQMFLDYSENKIYLFEGDGNLNVFDLNTNVTSSVAGYVLVNNIANIIKDGNYIYISSDGTLGVHRYLQRLDLNTNLSTDLSGNFSSLPVPINFDDYITDMIKVGDKIYFVTFSDGNDEGGFIGYWDTITETATELYSGVSLTRVTYNAGTNSLFIYGGQGNAELIKLNLNNNQLTSLTYLLNGVTTQESDAVIKYSSVENGVFFAQSNSGGLVYYQDTFPTTPLDDEVTDGFIYNSLSEAGNGIGVFLSAITHPLGSFIFYIALIGVVIALAVSMVYGIRNIAKRY